MDSLIDKLPQSALVMIGTLIVCNVGVIITIVTFIFKAGMFVAATKSGIKAANDTGVRAHKRIDQVEKRLE
jgi:hypothetical protein